MASNSTSTPALTRLDPSKGHAFETPKKCINDGDDVTFFLASKAYADIMTFIFQLNTSMIPRKTKSEEQDTESVKEWTLQDPDVSHPPVVQNLAKLLEALTAIIDEAPPDTGPRRFGNVSFRKWYDIVRERASDLLDQYLPPEVLAHQSSSSASAKNELEAYFIGSFGSAQRLDYGTGHELSFLAFLGSLWKLGAFPASQDGDQERGIVLRVIEPYLVLIRRLILTYTLEPAGSHGVWGLDDHSFVSYIFGSAQFSPPISTPADIATEGSLANAPNPADVAKAAAVQRERGRNMYFSAIGFIYDVKKGPFWEHSPILYDVSGVKAGWAKINKGMIKMYHAEVLSKFPVVQHFPFGSLFAWSADPNAPAIQASVHTSSQPKAVTPSNSAPTARQTGPPPPPQQQQPLRDPLAESREGITQMQMPMTAAPWARVSGPNVPAGPNQPTRAPWAASTRAPPLPPPGAGTTRMLPPGVGTAAPWAGSGTGAGSLGQGGGAEHEGAVGG
ncbi:Serine/threonine-protein phosphatase 2A activator 1 [Ascochyta rabiei]|uniref:Serine/threonine-protein phosphatase 2A activator n=1 Tax=Didymella rabiei TaxID=5454 RepID=A0A163F6D5_DIDRA|nr:Serine/threonine-protein phosphatase 2A activator 1 [Ascochyta rabiei]KZM24172.1 phosphatase activator [Ascochyta rabiei]UPX20612.1 Serine/threonine-protein phosphatase 2A activator 1 [Ascochyta rabiei]